MSDLKSPRYFYGWNIVAAAILIGYLTTGLNGYANGILLPHLADELAGGSRGQISLAFSTGTICASLTAPFVGRFADKHSPSRVMLFGAVLLAAGYVVMANATQLWHLFIAKGVFYGLAIAMAGPLVRNKIVAQWFDRIRGRALGFSVMGASIAGITLPIILSNLVSTVGWRDSVYIFAITVTLVLLPVIAFVMRDTPQTMGLSPDGDKASADAASLGTDKHGPNGDHLWTWKAMLKSRTLWATGLTFGPMVCVYFVIMVHLFGHALGSGLSETQAALVLSVLATSSIIGKPIIGAMADAIGARGTLWFALSCQAIAMLLFSIADTVLSFCVAGAIHGMGYAALSSMRTFALARAFGTKSLGSAVGLLSWIELPFAAMASPIAGFVYDATGSYDSAFLIFAGFLALGCIGPLLLKIEGPSRPGTAPAT